ncbi:hypothetical protein KC340_g10723 [Hortaea werneckii]|nr:hypothetical protein KC342_g2915 [Hortaea werneckii]KAI7103748.1 hypothetical protein KC339_g5032 [Hortaea werneckii]KAI7227031.1 hypothetical protein KC365_g9128 [Hortaea werneckii]KAI7309566.1 hypothetical protein KC340_g10723 [Hortaea werneckii]KAI7367791.1 hypothetical protein KC328_g18256 [Hortaea werneckii]
MGNAQSYMRSLASKADSILPPYYENGWYEKSNASSDREHFIQGVVTVLTQNGQISLSDHELLLLYARRESDRLVARIVAKKDGVIHSKIEPMELDVILSHVPGANAAASKNFAASDASLEAATSQSTGGNKSGVLQGWSSLASNSGVGGNAKTESRGSGACAMPVCSPPAYRKDANETDVKRHLLGERGWDDQ